MRYLLTSLLCVFTLSLTAQYSLTVESSEALFVPGNTVYRFYVNMADASDKFSAVYGNDQDNLIINTPAGIFNSLYNYCNVNPVFWGLFPEIQDDSYISIGDIPCDYSDGYVCQELIDYFTIGGTSLLINTLTGCAVYNLNTDENNLQIDGRVFIMQITTSGSISGTLNYQVFPLGVGANQVQISVDFDGAGTFGDGTIENAYGCMDYTASNYDPNATEDDGSCLFTGCMDSTSCNFNPDAIEDDGSCDYSCCPGPGCCDEGTYWNVDTQTCLLDITFCSWQPDSNADGNIGIVDLLDLLSVFGDTDYDEDGVFDSVDDCVDLAACNYQANPTEPCAYIDVLGVCGGGCEGDGDDNGICDEWEFNSCGDFIGHQDYYYSTVQIGDQCWFSENCRYLPSVSPSSVFYTSGPYYYVYGYGGTDVTAAQATSNYATYGVLYNWPAVMTEGICPSGWHIPSDAEFTELTNFLGGESVAGYAMKSTSGWTNNGNGSNSNGWTGLPGGFLGPGGFSGNGDYGYWWSASESGSGSLSRTLYFNYDNVLRHVIIYNFGFSARCVRD